jgi:predicted neutral ceramidase superfamily lipid hydrolase
MLVRYLDVFEPRGIALIAWVAAFLAIVSIAMCIIEARSWTWRILLLVTVSAEQFIAGLCLLKMSFWYSTYVVFGDKAYLANAANLGIIAAGLGAAVFAVLFVAILVLVKKDSPLNILTRSWVALSVFTVIEVLALLIVLFGGLLTVV